MLELGRGVQGITFEVIRSFQLEQEQRSCWESYQTRSFQDKRCQRMTHTSKKSWSCSKSREVIPNVNIDNIKKAIKAEQDGRYAARVVAVLKACVQEAVSYDGNKFEVLKNGYLESSVFLCRKIA